MFPTAKVVALIATAIHIKCFLSWELIATPDARSTTASATAAQSGNATQQFMAADTGGYVWSPSQYSRFVWLIACPDYCTVKVKNAEACADWGCGVGFGWGVLLLP